MGDANIRRLYSVAAGLLAILLAACGSTVQPARGGAAGAPTHATTPAPEGLAIGEPGSPQSGTEIRPPTRPAASTSDSPGPVAGDDHDPAASGTNAVEQRPGPRQQGDTDPETPRGPVEVGILVWANVSAMQSNAGIDDGREGEPAVPYRAAIDWANANGGLAGHEIEPVFGVMDTTSSEPFGAQEQRVCSQWTEDHRVVVALATNTGSDVLASCLAQRGVPLFTFIPLPFDAPAYTTKPLMFSPYPDQDRFVDLWVDGLAGQGYFDPEGAGPVRIGLLRYDERSQERVRDERLKPALARLGLEITSEAALTRPTTASEIGTVTTQMQSAALRFRTEGVTHLLFLDSGGGTVLMMIASENAGFRPRHGLSTYHGFSLIQQQAPRAQLEGALGIGWAPPTDVDEQRDPGLSHTGRLCLEIQERAGNQPTARTSRWDALRACDLVFLAKRAADAAGSVDASAIRFSMEGLGRVETAGTFGVNFAPDRHAGGTMVSDIRWDADCDCFTYVGAPRETVT